MLAVTVIERVPAAAELSLELGDPLLDRLVRARVEHHAQGVFGEHAGHIVGAEQHADAVGEARQQFVGLAQTDAAHQRGPVVRFDQQQRLALLALRRRGDGVVDGFQHAGAVEQAGDRVALQLFQHGLIDQLPAEHDLQAGFALERGRCEFHRGVELAAVGAARMQGELGRRLLLPCVAAQQGLEFVGMGRVDHVQHRQPEQVVEAVVAERFQVGVVGPYVHALVHVRDRIGGRVEQRVAAALRFAQGGLQATHLAARLQRLELTLQHRDQLLRLAARGDAAGAVHEQVRHDLVVDGVDQAQQRVVAAVGIEHLDGFLQADAGDRRVEHHHVRFQLVHRSLHLFHIGGTGRPHGNAGIAQQADDLLGLFQRALDEEDLDDEIFFHGAWCCPLIIAGGAGEVCAVSRDQCL